MEVLGSTQSLEELKQAHATEPWQREGGCTNRRWRKVSFDSDSLQNPERLFGSCSYTIINVTFNIVGS